jgi:hypothetical protein
MTHSATARPVETEAPESNEELIDTSQPGSADTPTWFSRVYGSTTTDDIADRYRHERPATATEDVPNQAAQEAYRRRLEQRFAMAQHLADPRYQHPQVTEAEPAPLFPERPRRQATAAQPRAHTAQPGVLSGKRPVMLAILTLTACSIGALLGYVAANPSLSWLRVQGGVAYFGSLIMPASGPVRETVITKKPVRMARLDVQDATGAVNTPIALNIAAFPSAPDMKLALRITGLPPAAYLTKGQELSAGEWVVRAEDIGKAALVVPHATVPQLDLEVAALEEKTGELTSPAQGLKVALDLAAVPAPGVPLPPPEDVKVIPASALPDRRRGTLLAKATGCSPRVTFLRRGSSISRPMA